jgi:hypothetical protein
MWLLSLVDSNWLKTDTPTGCPQAAQNSIPFLP